jgi:hypothetical protein
MYNMSVYSATATASYSATSSGSASATASTREEAIKIAKQNALESAKNAIGDEQQPDQIIEVDNFIIGAGIGGTYLAARLLNLLPNDSILVVDKLNDYGGLQTSSQIKDTTTTIELGPIRFYPSIHLRIDYLQKKYNLPIIEYLPESKGQVCYLRGKNFTLDKVFPDSDSVYNIREDEKGLDPFVTLENNLKKYIPSTENLYDFEYRIELFKNVEYSSAVFQPLAQQDMSEENWERITDLLGFNDMFSVKANFLVNAFEFLVLSSGQDTKQYRFANGYSSLTKTIATKNNIKKIDFQQLNKTTFQQYKHNAVFNTAVLNIEFSESKKMWKIEIGNVSVNSVEDIKFTPYSIKTIYAKKIYSAMSTQFLPEIHNFPNKYENLCRNSFVKFTPIRIYLKFDTDWMTEKGIGFGVSFTTLNGAQLIHYSDKVLMFYGFGTQTSKLFNYFPENIQIQKEMIKPNNSHKLLIEECIKIIKTSYGVDTLPSINGIAYATWISPVSFFSGRNQQTLKYESLYDQIMQIMFPYGKDGNFYVFDNSASFNAGWNDGSMELVDFYMNIFYGTPLFGPQFIN